jgi:hypothetical protein
LGTTADLTPDVRWLAPLPLWTGILAGPVAWAVDLTASYALVKWTCEAQSGVALHLVTIVALAIVFTGFVTSWMALKRTTDDVPTDGAHPRQRARFMAILGLSTSALFTLAIAAGAVPRWILDACN